MSWIKCLQDRLRISHKAAAFIGSGENSHPKSIHTAVIEVFYLGIDIGKTNHVASMLADHEQKPLFKGFSFTNTVEGAESLVSMIDRFVHDGDKLSIGMEATGHYWLALYSFLSERGYTIHLINPIQTDGWRKGIEIRKRKTDNIVHRELRQAYSKLTIVADEMGTSDYMKSFCLYVSRHQDQANLLGEADFQFAKSDHDVRIQIADFISGTLARVYDDHKKSEHAKEYLDVLKQNIIRIGMYRNRSIIPRADDSV